MESSERHLLCEVCSKLEVVQVNQQTVYYFRESTVHGFYEELYSSLLKAFINDIGIIIANESDLTVQTIVLETLRGLACTPRIAVGPRPNVVLISLNGQVLGDIEQTVK